MCQSERAASSVVWRKGIAELRAGRKYEITQKGQVLQLTIKNLEKSDSDTYSCDIGDAQSRAKLTVQGRNERNVVVHPFCAVPELDLSRAAEPLVSGSVSLMMAGTELSEFTLRFLTPAFLNGKKHFSVTNFKVKHSCAGFVSRRNIGDIFVYSDNLII